MSAATKGTRRCRETILLWFCLEIILFLCVFRLWPIVIWLNFWFFPLLWPPFPKYQRVLFSSIFEIFCHHNVNLIRKGKIWQPISIIGWVYWKSISFLLLTLSSSSVIQSICAPAFVLRCSVAIEDGGVFDYPDTMSSICLSSYVHYSDCAQRWSLSGHCFLNKLIGFRLRLNFGSAPKWNRRDKQ